MLPDLLNNVAVGEGFLNLFVSLSLLTLVSVVLLVVSRKWMLPTRSFLLLGMIFSYVIIMGLNLAFFGKSNQRPAMISFTLPAIEAELQAESVLSGHGIVSGHSSGDMPLFSGIVE